MPPRSARRDLSLKGLELFQICAAKGSLQAVAEDTGLSISTVSHHLRNLEEHLGVALFDHARRPMVLTPKGRSFLRNIDDALYAIRKAKAEASAGDLTEASYLRLGLIEDFDADIAPHLAVDLSAEMPSCDFLYLTDTSQTIVDMLKNRQLDLGVMSSATERPRDLVDRPLLRDPFVVVLPSDAGMPVADVVAGRTDLPFLRFAGNLIIARQIDAHLRRSGIVAPHRFECSNTHMLLAMAAAGSGWAITTPLLFSGARQFHAKLRMHPFPGKSFARTLSVVATPDCSASVLDLVDARMRHLVDRHAVQPSLTLAPWLGGAFSVID